MDPCLERLFEDLRLQREQSLKNLTAAKERSLFAVKNHFRKIMLTMPKHIADSTLESLFEQGLELVVDSDDSQGEDAPKDFKIVIPSKLWKSQPQQQPESTYLEHLEIPSNDYPSTNQCLQSTIRDNGQHIIITAPRFEDISAITPSKLEEFGRPKQPARIKLNFGSARKSPRGPVSTRHQVVSTIRKPIACKKAEAPLLLAPSARGADGCANDVAFNSGTFIVELREKRNQSLKNLESVKEELKAKVKNHYDELRAQIPELEKEYLACKDENDFEKFLFKLL